MDINTCYAGTLGIRELAMYSHLIPALAIIVLGLLAFEKAVDRNKAGIFLAFSLTFAGWLVLDLIPWVSNSYTFVAATWAPLDYMNIAFFMLLFYFIYADMTVRQGRTWHFTGLLALAVLVPFLVTVSGKSVGNFDLATCEMAGNDFLATYKLGFELTMLLATLLLGGYHILESWRDATERIRSILIVGSIASFMCVFAVAEYMSVQTEVYEIMLYTLFALPLFVMVLTLAITNYGTFRLGDSAIKVLFYIFLILAATQYFYVGDLTEFLLASMSFLVILSLGIMLFRSNEREIAFRHQLEFANQQQETLLHFISHEVKGFLTEGQNAFAGIVEGDFGEPTPQLKEVAHVALGKMRNGVSTVMDILDAANLKKGTMQYKKTTFDLVESVKGAVQDLMQSATAKSLTIGEDYSEGSVTVIGDEEKIRRHVLRNLIDNAIKYTPRGNIYVRVRTKEGVVQFSVTDSGVGITAQDMKLLFTEGGHGKNSIKTNVSSTGYGLFVAKSVVDAHGGKIWAESAGEGKGSTFVVELPLTS